MLTASKLAAGLAVLVVFMVVAYAAFVLVLRNRMSGPSAKDTKARALAARLTSGSESTVDPQDVPGGVVFRVGVPTVSGVEGTHDGIVVCLREGTATEAVRFSFLRYTPGCDGGRAAMGEGGRTAAQDRQAYGNAIVGNAQATTEPGLRRVTG